MVDDPISVLCAADESYGLQAATTLRSVCESHAGQRPLDLWLLSDGMKKETLARVADSLKGTRHTLNVVDCSSVTVPEVHRAGLHLTYLSRAASLRLKIAQIVPERIEKLIYLDSDLLVLEDIEHLWETALPQEKACGAVQDVAIPFHGSKRHLQKTGLLTDPSRPYLNSGVLLINVPVWRKMQIGERALALLADSRDPLPFHDQDALNVILDGAWAAIDPAWNCPAEYHFRRWNTNGYGYGNPLPFPPVQPKILHFCGAAKPWRGDYPYAEGVELYRTHVNRTSWKE